MRAIVTRDPVSLTALKKRASLLAKDSIYDSFKGIIDIDKQSNSLIINGMQVQFISAQNPADVNYKDFGIDNALLIDNTGKYKEKKTLTHHLSSGSIAKVIVTAPAIDIPNIVFGVNHQDRESLCNLLLSTASCTTNAIAPVLQVLDNQYGIRKAHVETLHAYTNDQNLVDNFHEKARRGRAATLNMVITQTGAGAALAKIIPELKDRITTNAIRVPIANGSLAVLVVELNMKTSIPDVHQLFLPFALKPGKHKQIDVSFDEELVSSDILGNTATGVIDAPATTLSADGHTLSLYIWYDNEYGYAIQVLGFASYLSTEHIESNYVNEESNEVVGLMNFCN